MAEQASGPESKAPVRRAGRSPGYPGIDLQTALQRAQDLWEAQRQHPAPVDSIYETWGYSKNSGAGNVAFAALRKFGLLAVEGSGAGRQGRLSDLALDIIRDERPDSEERAAAIRRAALAPGIHREVWDRFEGDLPPDATLQHYLERQRGFTPSGAREFIQELRRTMAFADVSEADNIVHHDGDNGAGAGGKSEKLDSRRKTPPGMKTVELPLGPDKWARLEGAFPLNEQDWDLMLAILTAMKPGLVSAPERPEHEGHQE